MTVLRPPHRFRRLSTIAATALVLGVAVHGVCQAIEHHDGVKDAVALCAAAVALVATALVGGTREGASLTRLPWLVFSLPLPLDLPRGSRTSAAWLQRFRN